MSLKLSKQVAETNQNHTAENKEIDLKAHVVISRNVNHVFYQNCVIINYKNTSDIFY